MAANKALITDKDLNQYEIEKLLFDFKEDRIIGKDTTINNNNKISDKEYLPRAKGRYFLLENDNITLRKSI